MEPLDRLTETIERRCRKGETGAAVRQVVRLGDELVRRFKERMIQELIDRAVREHLGERRRGRPRRRLSPWSCRNCGPRLGSELRRNGH